MRKLQSLFIVLLAALIGSAPVLAQQLPTPPALAAKSWLLIESGSGQELAAQAADERLEPASLTKLMTAYLTFAALKQGTIKIDQPITVSEKAWKTQGSRMFIQVGTQVKVEDLIKGMIVQSGNDACVALAEAIAGNEEVFAQAMNREAQRLGMKSTSFRNAAGLPDPQHYTTARDLATLAGALIRDFPEDYAKYYSLKQFRYNNITQPNRNRLLFIDPTVDGVKTGHTDAAGYCLISSAKRGPRRLLAVVLGAVTPFCSCSAVPLFIGFLSAGVPLGVTFSFLISAPMVNEVALVLLFGMFGWKIATLYLVMGLLVAIVAGFVIGKLGMERHLEDWVQKIQAGQGVAHSDQAMSWVSRFEAGWAHVKSIVGKVWPYILLGIGLGAAIHGFVPEDFMASFMGKEVWWAVPAAVVLGVPMYTNAAGIIPIVEALIGKGAALGTVLAFMMAVIALSAPEMIILRKALKPTLIATFAGVVACGIMLVGYVFNAVL